MRCIWQWLQLELLCCEKAIGVHETIQTAKCFLVPVCTCAAEKMSCSYSKVANLFLGPGAMVILGMLREYHGHQWENGCLGACGITQNGCCIWKRDWERNDVGTAATTLPRQLPTVNGGKALTSAYSALTCREKLFVSLLCSEQVCFQSWLPVKYVHAACLRVLCSVQEKPVQTETDQEDQSVSCVL